MIDLDDKESLGRLVLKSERMELIKTYYAKSKGIPANIFWKDTTLTAEGIKYLQDNSGLNKLYNTAKKVADLIT